jgi:hypothetical protein
MFFRNVCRLSTETDLIYKMLQKLETIWPSETSIDFQQKLTWCIRCSRKWSWYVLPKRLSTSQTIEEFMTTAVRTSNPEVYVAPYIRNSCLLYEWNSGVTNVIRYTVRVKSVPLHDVLDAFLKIVFFQFFQKCFNVLQWTLTLCIYLSHCVDQVEFSGDDGVPFATGTLNTSNLAEMRVCLLPLEH